MSENRVTLHCQEGSSDKLYSVWMEPEASGYMVRAQWGRRGGPMQSGVKTPAPVPLEKANALLAKIIREKQGKGYVPYGEASASYTVVDNPKDTGVRLMLLSAASEEDIESFIKDPAWGAQQKLNGKRIAVKMTGTEIIGINKKGLECSIPESVKSEISRMEELEGVLDGELVADVYNVFDVAHMTGIKLSERMDTLKTFCSALDSSIVKFIPFVPGEAEKRDLVDRLRRDRKEGVVFKRLDSVYTPGKIENLRKAIAVKVKFYSEGSFIVGDYTDKNSVTLFATAGAGDGERIAVGKVTVPAKYQNQIAAGKIARVRYLYATEASILYQPNLDPDDSGSVVRDDQTPMDCPLTQLKYEGKDD